MVLVPLQSVGDTFVELVEVLIDLIGHNILIEFLEYRILIVDVADLDDRIHRPVDILHEDVLNRHLKHSSPRESSSDSSSRSQ